jgi:DNA-binding MarR family transcriptional regulator
VLKLYREVKGRLASNSKPELIQQILGLHLQIQRQIRGDAPGVWLTLDLTIAQLKSLFFINYEGETNLKNLASALGVTPPNVTGIIDRLVEHGLVSREYNQLNRREQVLKLTAAGEEQINKLNQLAVTRLTLTLERLDVKDLAALSQGLAALNAGASIKE